MNKIFRNFLVSKILWMRGLKKKGPEVCNHMYPNHPYYEDPPWADKMCS